MFYEKVCIQNKFQILFTFANFSILITHYICRKVSYAWVMSTLESNSFITFRRKQKFRSL